MQVEPDSVNAAIAATPRWLAVYIVAIAIASSTCVNVSSMRCDARYRCVWYFSAPTHTSAIDATTVAGCLPTAVSAAVRTAGGAGNPNVEPVHLLRALLAQSEGTTRPLLAAVGVDADQLIREADAVAAEFALKIDMNVRVSGESFLTPPGELSGLVSAAVQAETGITPVLSTTGGTSDARFVKDHCPVVEFGLVGKTMHQVDECVPIEQISQLKAVYSRILRDYFA